MGAAPALARLRDDGVDVDEVAQALGHPVRDGRADHAAVGVDDQHDLVQLFHLDGVGHVGDVRLQRDRGRHEVHALAHAGERHGMHAMPGPGQRRHHVAPAPAAVPGAVDEQEIRHLDHLLRCHLRLWIFVAIEQLAQDCCVYCPSSGGR